MHRVLGAACLVIALSQTYPAFGQDVGEADSSLSLSDLEICAGGSDTRISGSLEGSLKSIKVGKKTVGSDFHFSNLGAFLQLIPEGDRIEAFRLYQQCLQLRQLTSITNRSTAGVGSARPPAPQSVKEWVSQNSKTWVRACSNGVCYVSSEIEGGVDGVDRINISYLGFSQDAQPSSYSDDHSPELRIPVPPNSKVSFKLLFKDGTSSDTLEVQDTTNNTVTSGTVIQSNQGTDEPALLAAYETSYRRWTFRVATTGWKPVGYSLDGSPPFPITEFVNEPWDGQGFHVELGAEPFLWLKLRNDADGKSGFFKYRVPREISTEANVVAFSSHADGLLECRRFDEQWFPSGGNSFDTLMKQTNNAMSLASMGYGFVDRPSVGCMIPKDADQDRLAAVSAISEIRIDSDMTQEVTAQPVTDDSRKDDRNFIHNYAHIQLPVRSDQVFVAYVLKDGEVSEQIRVPIADIPPQ